MENDDDLVQVQGSNEIQGEKSVQPDPESEGERRVQPDPESVSKVLEFDVSLTKTTQRKPIIWPNHAAYLRWMRIDRRLGSVDPYAAAEKLWRKRAKRLRLANKEDTLDPSEYYVT